MKRLQLFLLLLFALFTNGYAAIDLIVTDVIFENNQKQLGQFNASIVVKNIGSEAISSLSLTELYLSKDNVYSNDDISAGYISVSTLDAGTTLEKTIIGGAYQFGINADDSYHFLIAVTDYRYELNESDETNNILVKPITIINSTIDLTLESYQKSSPDILKHGDVLNMNVVLKNLGSDDLNSAYYEYFLSADNVFDNQDIKIGYINYAGFNWTKSASPFTDKLAISPNVTPGYYNVFIRINQEGQEIKFVDSNLSNNTVMLCKIYIDYSDKNTVLNFDQDFGTQSWSEDGLAWSFVGGNDDIRTYTPYAGSSHAMSVVGFSSKLTCSENVNAYGIWVLIDDVMTEISSLKIVAYGNDGNEKYSKDLIVSDYSNIYTYLTLNWIDIKSIVFVSTTDASMPMSIINYDELDYRAVNVNPTSIASTPKHTDVKVYPSICNEKITIEGNKEIEVVEIYNMLGVRVKQTSLAGLMIGEINTSDLPSANYFVMVKFKSEDEPEVIKIIKQ